MASSAVVRPDLLAAIEDGGYRLTSARRRISKTIEMFEEGFTAESVLNDVPGVGRATVFRTIRLLLDAGLLCRLPMPDGSTRYNLTRVDHHHHTLCVSCGTVSEFRDSTIERLVRSIGREIRGEIVGHRMEFEILCEGCLPETQ